MTTIAPILKCQRVNVRVELAGVPETSVSASGDGTGAPGTLIIVTINSILIYLSTRRAVSRYAFEWLDNLTGTAARTLPHAASHAACELRPSQIALAIHASSNDEPEARRTAAGLEISIGNVTWVCRDQTAYGTLRRLWSTTSDLTRAMFPDHDGSW